MRSMHFAQGGAIILLLVVGASDFAFAAAGDHIVSGEHVKISPDGRRIGYIEDSGIETLLWVSSINNPENRRPVTTWTESDRAFEWADDHNLALARDKGFGTVLVVMPVDGLSAPIEGPTLPGSFISLSKDAIDSVVAVASGDHTQTLRYSQTCACFSEGVAPDDKVSWPARLNSLFVWGASWDGMVLLVSDSTLEDGGYISIYSPQTGKVEPLFSSAGESIDLR